MNPSSSHLGHRQRLRDRWRQAGEHGFADHELLEILLSFVIPRRDTKPIAKNLLNKFGSFKNVFDASPRDLSVVPGLGDISADFLNVVRGVMTRYFSSEIVLTDLLNSPDAVVRYCRAHLEGLKNEVFDVVYLSTKNRVLGRDRLSEGTLDQTAVYPRRVVAGALAANAAGVILVHNHPSGDPAPSVEDKQLTTRLVQATATVGVSVLDHLIIGNGRYFSFRDKGLI